MEQMVLELQVRLGQMLLAAEYVSQRLLSSSTTNQQDVSTCASLDQHLCRAQKICDVLTIHAEMIERIDRTIRDG